MKVFGTVRFRLAMWNVAVIAVVLAIFGYSLKLKIQSDLLTGVDAALENSANRSQQSVEFTGNLPSYLLRRGMPDGLNSPAPLPTGTETVSSGRPAISTGSGVIVPFGVAIINPQAVPLDPEHLAWDNRTISRSIGGERVYSTVRYAGQPVRVLSVPIYRQKRLVHVLQFARSLSPVNLEVDRLVKGLLTLIPLALLIVGGGALLLTDRALRPVRDIVLATEGIEASDLSGRLSERGSDEFSDLASTINNMLGRLEKAFGLLREASEQQRRFTADASHELRTPLTIIKANTTLALSVERTPDEYRRTLDAVDRAADRMAKIVQDLLYIARSDAGQIFVSPEPVELRSVILQALETVSDNKGHTIKYDIPAKYWIAGDEDSLVRLFTNVLQNACKYTPAGGKITVNCCQNDNWNTVSVTDTGIGISKEHIEHLGERFFRVDNGRAREEGGTGLGLAICRSIVDSHCGTMTIESSVGIGTTVSIKLPTIEPRSVNNGCSDSSITKARSPN